MFKKIKENVVKVITGLDNKVLFTYLLVFFASSLLLGTLIGFVFENATAALGMGSWHFRLGMLIEPVTWLIGIGICLIFVFIYALNGGFRNSGLIGRSLLFAAAMIPSNPAA